MNACELEHLALFYANFEQYLAGTREFIEEGLACGERVLVSVPGAKIDPLRSMLNGGADRVEFWNMNEVGRNPGCIIPAVRDWFERGNGGRGRFIGEPIWPGRSATEVVEATRHEALINLAFADVPATILCPYDTAGLDGAVVADAERTHPQLLDGGGHESASSNYTDPLVLWRAREWPLCKPDGASAPYPISPKLGELRDLTATRLRAAGLDEERIDDVVLAVDEAATNALIHGRGEPELRIWRDARQVVCEITDQGTLEEPLAGRFLPRPDQPRGRGVWLMNQLCDLVELRPVDCGTTVRLHVSLEAQSSCTAG
jgi:anti-sigma regulatory factor (Ser/Thr protein kinase)